MQKAALWTSGIIFLIVSALHIVRSLLKLTITVEGSAIPLEASWIGAVLSLALAVWMFIGARK